MWTFLFSSYIHFFNILLLLSIINLILFPLFLTITLPPSIDPLIKQIIPRLRSPPNFPHASQSDPLKHFKPSHPANILQFPSRFPLCHLCQAPKNKHSALTPSTIIICTQVLAKSIKRIPCFQSPHPLPFVFAPFLSFIYSCPLALPLALIALILWSASVVLPPLGEVRGGQQQVGRHWAKGGQQQGLCYRAWGVAVLYGTSSQVAL